MQTITNPDGSREYYEYDNYGRPTKVLSMFGDYQYGRETQYIYDPGQISDIWDYGDHGTLNTNTPRRMIEYVNGALVSCRYAVFPSVGGGLGI